MPRTKNDTFERVVVDYAIKGVSRITWHLRREAVYDSPQFQLQVNRNGGDDEENWEDVGTVVTDVNYALDDTQRTYGLQWNSTYRVQLIDGLQTINSPPAQVLGQLGKRQWLMARAIMRRLILRARGYDDFRGYLFSRKHYGSQCSCIDPLAGGLTNSDCELCWGTGFTQGFWQSATHIMYNLQPYVTALKIDEQLVRGTVDDKQTTGVFLGLPVIKRGDLWVSADSDKRYAVHEVQRISELNQVPLAVAAKLKLLETSDIAYDLVPVEN